MILLPSKSLSGRALRILRQRQKAVADIGGYAKQVALAEKSFGTINKSRDKTFVEVRKILFGMSSGVERCHYCEDSKADEVEHIAPKNWYPEKCFDWENFCIACGPCNGPKSNQFAVFKQSDGSLFEFSPRKKGDPILPPPPGFHVLINPRFEDPMQFLFLDITGGTFRFCEMADDEHSREFQRAKFTIKILGLNSRSDLPTARRNAYANYRARLREYITEKNDGATTAKLEELALGIRTEHHATVWAEMKRQWGKIPELQPLFAEIQEEINEGIL